MNDLLDEFFYDLQKEENSRYLSWEHCYLFFLKNRKNIITDENLLDLASLHLSFYLASWGMYRASSKLLNKDYKVHKKLIKELLSKCSCLWKKNITWEQLEIANNIIKQYYKKQGVTPTNTLITKILMGIFACVPAYDRFFMQGLKAHKTNFAKISHNYKRDSFESLQQFVKYLKPRNLILNHKIPYPAMRLIDTYFWLVGYKLDNQKN